MDRGGVRLVEVGRIRRGEQHGVRGHIDAAQAVAGGFDTHGGGVLIEAGDGPGSPTSTGAHRCGDVGPIESVVGHIRPVADDPSHSAPSGSKSDSILRLSITDCHPPQPVIGGASQRHVRKRATTTISWIATARSLRGSTRSGSQSPTGPAQSPSAGSGCSPDVASSSAKARSFCSESGSGVPDRATLALIRR